MCIRQKQILFAYFNLPRGKNGGFLCFVIFFYLGLVQTNEAKSRWGGRKSGLWAFFEGALLTMGWDGPGCFLFPQGNRSGTVMESFGVFFGKGN